MTAVNCYQSDVTKLSDEELLTLSAELLDAFHCVYVNDDMDECDWWTDSQAQERHREMVREIDRRWEIANPEEAAIRRETLRRYAEVTLPILHNSLVNASKLMDRTFLDSSHKIGSTLVIQRPTRFRG